MNAESPSPATKRPSNNPKGRPPKDREDRKVRVVSYVLPRDVVRVRQYVASLYASTVTRAIPAPPAHDPASPPVN